MKTKMKGIIPASLLIALTGLLTVIAILLPKFQVAPEGIVTGSVTQGNEYFASTTRDYKGAVMPSLAVLKIGSGALGSVVITGAAASQINLYDSTSTQTNTLWSTTTLATFPISTATGTYTFDVVFSKGLLVEFVTTASTPTSTITWR